MTLSNLTTFSMPWSVMQHLCNSWASCKYRFPHSSS